MSRTVPEIYAPGETFHAALAAFDAGADAVYLGLAEFSARKAAANFSFDQLRRIRAVAVDRGRRIAVTVNTVVREAARRLDPTALPSTTTRCPRAFDREVWQGRNRFRVVVRDCITYLLRARVHHSTRVNTL